MEGITMTEKEYLDNFNQFMSREGLTNLSPGDDYEEFSTTPCDVCKSNLAGQRNNATGYHPESSSVFEYSICVDCLMFCANGDLPEHVY
jgi:hypothetical protein